MATWLTIARAQLLFKVTPLEKRGEDPAMGSGRNVPATIFDSTTCQGVELIFTTSLSPGFGLRCLYVTLWKEYK